MEITFKNKKLKKLCEQKSQAQRELGDVSARKLQARIADLMTVGSVRELVAGRPHPLKGDRLGQFALDIGGSKRLVFKPACNPIPLNKDESIDWSKVTCVCIVFIGDYHD